MINIRHMKKFLVTIILSLLLSSHSFADKKLDKHLKKVSKDNGLIENNGKIYSIDNISDKKILFWSSIPMALMWIKK